MIFVKIYGKTFSIFVKIYDKMLEWKELSHGQSALPVEDVRRIDYPAVLSLMTATILSLARSAISFEVISL